MLLDVGPRDGHDQVASSLIATQPPLVVSSYADVARCLRHPALSSAITLSTLSQAPDAVATTYETVLRRQLDLIDPPRHTALRQLFSPAFSSERLSRARICSAEWLAARLSGLPGTFDLIEEIARPLPLAVVLDFLGLPEDAQAPASRAVAQFVEGLRDPVGSHASTSAALQSLRRLLSDVLTRTDLAEGSLVQRAQMATPHDMDFEEVVAAVVLTIAAGHEPTTHLIGNGAWLLLAHPGQRALVASDPSDGWNAAIDEMLRFEGPVQSVRRVATAALDVSGQPVEAGRELVLAIGTANRDPEAFTDPDRFDVRRSPNRHLAFGSGAHFCLGAQLARIQARAVFEAIFSRPSLRAIDTEPAWMTSSPYRGLSHLIASRF